MHYYRPDFTEGQAKSLIRDMCEDLQDFAAVDIEEAIRQYRRDPKNKFFPTSGALRGLAAEIAKERNLSARFGARPTIAAHHNRPALWWTKARALWAPDWHESEVPNGELVRDRDTGKMRHPRC